MSWLPLSVRKLAAALTNTPLFMSPKEIGEELRGKLTPEDIQAILDLGDKDQLHSLHHGYGMWIRNTYNLWHEKNPHTMLDYQPELRDGADYSPRHPDAVSMRIIEQLYAKLKAERGAKIRRIK